MTATEPVDVVAPFAPIEVCVRRGDESIVHVEIPGEIIDANRALAITPTVGPDGRFHAGHALTHIPTGLAVAQGDPGHLRDVGAKLAHLDWANFTRDNFVGSDAAAEALRIIREAEFTEPSGVELPAHDAWGPNGKGMERQALPLIGNFLADFQRAYNRQWGKNGETKVPFNLPDGTHNPEWTFLILRQVHDYGLAYLLAALHRIDPAVADSAAAALADAWESGDSLGEWVYQWRQELDASQPLTLHGIPGPVGDLFAAT